MLPAGIEITTDRARINVKLVHEFLASSYWAKGRSRAIVERSLENSLCFGAFQGEHQVALGRVITDYAVFAYIADVFVTCAIPWYWHRQGAGESHARTSGLEWTSGHLTTHT